MTNRQLVVRQLPEGDLRTDHFDVIDGEMPVPGPGEALVRTVMLSLDPVNRLYLVPAAAAVDEAPPEPPSPEFTRRAQPWRDLRKTLGPGDVMDAFTLCEVIDSNGTDLPEGAVVVCSVGAQEYAAVHQDWARVLDVRAPLQHYLGVLGVTGGISAYVGLLHKAPPRPGDTVVVSSAAGSVGSAAGQLAKLAGARVVGLTSSEVKGRILVDELGFDAAVDYRSDSFFADLLAACPEGVDVFFDNVGGPVLETVLNAMGENGRVSCCGNVANYDRAEWRGPGNLPFILVVKRLQMIGWAIHDNMDVWPEAEARLTRWLAEGRIKPFEDVTEGLEAMPERLVDMLGPSSRFGKQIIRVGPDPSSSAGAQAPAGVAVDG